MGGLRRLFGGMLFGRCSGGGLAWEFSQILGGAAFFLYRRLPNQTGRQQWAPNLYSRQGFSHPASLVEVLIIPSNRDADDRRNLRDGIQIQQTDRDLIRPISPDSFRCLFQGAGGMDAATRFLSLSLLASSPGV
jgi:hypothetical protein